jgi:hypothetical protein
MSATPHHSRMPLIQVPTVRDITGLRRDEIFDRVDGASLLHPALVWVWDLATTFPAGVRDLRFWREECVPHGRSLTKLSIEQVIDRVLPKGRTNFHSGEVLQMFALSRQNLLALRDELNGDLRGARNVTFARAQLVAFLERRWINRKTISPRAAPNAFGDTNKQTTHAASPLP